MGDIVTANTAAEASEPANFERIGPQFNVSLDRPSFSRRSPSASNDAAATLNLASTKESLKEGLIKDPKADLTEAEQLRHAVIHNDTDTVKALIKAGVDLRPVQWDEPPVLVTAAEKGYLKMVQVLVAANANVNSGYSQLPLHGAAANGHFDVVKYLLGVGAHIHAPDCQGYTALMRAAAAGQLSVVRYLISVGASLGAPSESSLTSETALTLAQKAQHSAVCEFLSEWIQAIAPAPVPAAPPADAAPTSQAPSSIMDEMIANTTAELNELLASST